MGPKAVLSTLKANTSACKFYERVGWTLVSTREKKLENGVTLEIVSYELPLRSTTGDKRIWAFLAVGLASLATAVWLHLSATRSWEGRGVSAAPSTTTSAKAADIFFFLCNTEL